jgi:hypothetical protein
MIYVESSRHRKQEDISIFTIKLDCIIREENEFELQSNNMNGEEVSFLSKLRWAAVQTLKVQ